jgi:phosphatidate cytidylyltransferase
MDPGRRDPAARAATTLRFGRPQPIVGVVLLVLALLTARLGPAPFCAFVAVVVGLAALELATSLKRQGAAVKPIAAGAGAAALAAGAYLWGEAALLTVAALLFVVYTGGLAIGSRTNLRPGTVRTLAALLLPAFYAGLAGAFLVLVRRGTQGTAMVEVFAGLVVAYRLGLWAGTRRAGGSPGRAGVGAGALACVVASPLLGLLLDHRPGVAPMIGLGLFVGLAAGVGTLGAGLLSGPPQPGAKLPPRPILGQIEPALLAAPAFFYAFRLLLT